MAKDVREINELKGRFQIIPAEGHFGIDKASEDDAGNYSCSLDGESHKFNVYGKFWNFFYFFFISHLKSILQPPC